METKLVSLQKIISVGICIVLIFSLLALIRAQNMQLLSKETVAAVKYANA